MPAAHSIGTQRRPTVARQHLKTPDGGPSLPRQILLGTLAGVVATAPMTAFMEGAFRFLSLRNRRSLPPRKITRNVTRKIGLWQRLSNRQRTALTLAAHFSYGGAMGGLYGLLVPVRYWSAASGAACGFLAWAGNYLGILPGLNLHEAATRHPRQRNVLMIVAHLVWGGALGTMLQFLKPPSEPQDES